MDSFVSGTPFAGWVAEGLEQQRFTLVDIGCSGGIHPAWRVFGEKLRAFAFDPNVQDIERVAAAEPLPGVEYVGAFVGLPSDDPGFERLQRGDWHTRSPWNRLSTARTIQLRAARPPASIPAQPAGSAPVPASELADPRHPVILPQFLHARGVTEIDFIKLDVDGPDYLLLCSWAKLVRETDVLGFCVEVNFHGSDEPGYHTFHNMDRLLKGWGFELFSITARPYSMAALPAPYQHAFPAQTFWGRPLQGDAIYLRDAAAPDNAAWAGTVSPHKLMKLAALFSLTALPDCAAELLTEYGTRLAPWFDVGKGLDLLAAQSTLPGERARTFREYIDEFEADSDAFYPTRNAGPEDKNVELAAYGIPPLTAAFLERRRPRTDPPRDLQIAQQRIAALENEVAALRNSTSWQLTRPLRLATDWARRALGRAG